MITLKRDRNWNLKYTSNSIIMEVVGVDEVGDSKVGDNIVIEAKGMSPQTYCIVDMSELYYNKGYITKPLKMMVQQATGFPYDIIPDEMILLMNRGFYIYQLMPIVFSY